MPIHASHFSPYLSLGLMVSLSKRRGVESLLKEIQEVVFLKRPKSEGNVKPTLTNRIEKFNESSVIGQGFVYRVREVPNWWQGPSPETPSEKEVLSPIRSEVHYVVLLLKLGNVFALYTSNSSDWGRVKRGISEKSVTGVELVSPEIINGAFTDANWPMGTVWMKGLHNSVESKADSKQLTGPNVRSAIDPFGDQTYHFSSGRSFVPFEEEHEALGLSPMKHRIWMGQSSSFQHFCEMAAWSMSLLADATAVSAPIAELAHPINSLDGLGVPEEISWAPTEDRSSWSEASAKAIDLLDGVSVELETADSEVKEGAAGRKVDIHVNIIEQGSTIAKVALAIRYPVSSTTISFEFKSQSPADTQTNWIDALRTIFVDERWGMLRYGNGYVVSGNLPYLPSYSTKFFKNWEWVDFASEKIDITKEKPVLTGESDKRKVDLALIGDARDDSLFSWIHDQWGQKRDGLLLCDDGSGEIADFLHLAPKDENGESALTLIHAKASKSADTKRGISVSQHEVVVSQAIKNLVHASSESIVHKLRNLSAKAMVWDKEGVVKSSSDFATVLDNRGPKIRLRVVILQPHTIRSKYEIDLKTATDSTRLWHAQLSTLLLEAEAASRSVGATFEVLASES